jgi:hypothetical protein
LGGVVVVGFGGVVVVVCVAVVCVWVGVGAGAVCVGVGAGAVWVAVGGVVGVGVVVVPPGPAGLVPVPAGVVVVPAGVVVVVEPEVAPGLEVEGVFDCEAVVELDDLLDPRNARAIPPPAHARMTRAMMMNFPLPPRACGSGA